MANYTVSDNKCLVDVLDVIPVKHISDITGDMSWLQVFARCSEGINVYSLSTCSDIYYPVEISETDTQDAAIVTITLFNNISFDITTLARIEFFYNGVIYTRQYKNASTQGAVLTPWTQVTTTAVNDE